MVQEQYKQIFNGSLHIIVINVFPNKNTVGSCSNQNIYYIGELLIFLPEYTMNTAVFHQLIMQLLFCKPLPGEL